MRLKNWRQSPVILLLLLPLILLLLSLILLLLLSIPCILILMILLLLPLLHGIQRLLPGEIPLRWRRRRRRPVELLAGRTEL